MILCVPYLKISPAFAVTVQHVHVFFYLTTTTPCLSNKHLKELIKLQMVLSEMAALYSLASPVIWSTHLICIQNLIISTSVPV